MAAVTNLCEVLLDCHHSFVFDKTIRPKRGDYIFCTRCNLGRTVIQSNSKQWRVRCPECFYTAYLGQDEAGAILKQIKHSQKTRHANVKAEYSNGLFKADPDADGNGDEMESSEGYLFH